MTKAILWLLGLLLFVAGFSGTSWTTTTAAAPTCRNAYASTEGAWGSARICYTPSGKGFYKTTLSGTIKDTKADHHRATLYVGYALYTPPLINSGRNATGDTKAIATANHKGATNYASWSQDDVKNVTIFVCTTDRFGGRKNCSRNR